MANLKIKESDWDKTHMLLILWFPLPPLLVLGFVVNKVLSLFRI